MRIVSTLVLSLAVVLNSIELSLQTSNPGPDVPRSEIPSSPDEHRAADSANRLSPLAGYSALYRLGKKPEDFKFIRLIPNTNPSRQFEIRRYTFPRNKAIYVRGDRQVLQSMPTEEETVLSTSDGEVFAIVEGNKSLRGIYASINGFQKRVKINMYSGAVVEMTTKEIQETPLGKNSSISKYFGILHIKTESSLQTPNTEPGSSSRSLPPTRPFLRERSRSPVASHSPLYLLGCKLEELGFIRLIPHSNPLRQFEVKRYTFPRDKPIRVRGHTKENNNVLLPMPTEEQTVLSTSSGEVFAIVQNNTKLRGIFTITHKRAKISMYGGAVEEMTKKEIQETPLGKEKPILKCFEVVRVNNSSHF